MAVRDWHPGQLAIVWGAGIGLGWMLDLMDQPTGTFGRFLAFFILLAVTWRWIEGRKDGTGKRGGQ